MTDYIRDFIIITESMFVEQNVSHPVEEVLMEHALPPHLNSEVEEQLRDVIFKLRSYRDHNSGDYAAGVEEGMAKAADMLDNLIERLRDN